MRRVRMQREVRQQTHRTRAGHVQSVRVFGHTQPAQQFNVTHRRHCHTLPRFYFELRYNSNASESLGVRHDFGFLFDAGRICDALRANYVCDEFDSPDCITQKLDAYPERFGCAPAALFMRAGDKLLRCAGSPLSYATLCDANWQFAQCDKKGVGNSHARFIHPVLWFAPGRPLASPTQIS